MAGLMFGRSQDRRTRGGNHRLGDPLPVALVLWVTSTTEDMDIFATIRNIDPDGKDVFEQGQQGQSVPVSSGQPTVLVREMTVGGTAA